MIEIDLTRSGYNALICSDGRNHPYTFRLSHVTALIDGHDREKP